MKQVVWVRLCLLLFGVSGAVFPGWAQAAEDAVGWSQVTQASWYGREFRGRPMADGRIFNPEKLTAAHRTLGLGTTVRVVELRSGRAVVVKITDRGPYIRGRGIDLSYAAARELGMVKKGVSRVRVEVVQAKNPVPSAPEAVAGVASRWLPSTMLE